MSKRVLVLLLSSILVLGGLLTGGVRQTLAAVYYVSPAGSDSNSGLRTAPWRNPYYGANRLKPGDALVIMAGRYVIADYDHIIRPPSGRAGAYITIQGEKNARPVLAGGNNLFALFELSGASYVHLRDLELTRDDKAGGEVGWCQNGIVIMEKPADHIILEDLYIHHLEDMGANVQDVNDFRVINCKVEYCTISALGGPNGLAGGWQNAVIKGCTLAYSGHYYHGGDGSDRPYDRPDGLEVSPSKGPLLIENTLAQHNRGDGLDSKAADTVIRQCVVANNSCDGIKLWQGDSHIENTLIYGRGDGQQEETSWASVVINGEKAGANYTLVHVTIDDHLGQNYLMYAMYNHQSVPVSITIRNCILQSAAPRSHIFISGATKLTADHNLFYLPEAELVLEHGQTEYTSKNLSAMGPGNLYGPPLFKKPAWGSEGDYRLEERSPAINAGVRQQTPLVDLNGFPRDSQPDLGAYEYGSKPKP